MQHQLCDSDEHGTVIMNSWSWEQWAPDVKHFVLFVDCSSILITWTTQTCCKHFFDIVLMQYTVNKYAGTKVQKASLDSHLIKDLKMAKCYIGQHAPCLGPVRVDGNSTETSKMKHHTTLSSHNSLLEHYSLNDWSSQPNFFIPVTIPH